MQQQAILFQMPGGALRVGEMVDFRIDEFGRVLYHLRGTNGSYWAAYDVPSSRFVFITEQERQSLVR